MAQPQSPLIPGSKSNRILAMDVYRGLTILGMMMAETCMKITGLPWWMEHSFNISAHNNHLAWADFVSPMFMVIMGAAIPLALTARLNKGDKWYRLVWHIVFRAAMLIWIGTALQAYYGRTEAGASLIQWWYDVVEGSSVLTHWVGTKMGYARPGSGVGFSIGCWYFWGGVFTIGLFSSHVFIRSKHIAIKVFGCLVRCLSIAFLAGMTCIVLQGPNHTNSANWGSSVPTGVIGWLREYLMYVCVLMGVLFAFPADMLIRSAKRGLVATGWAVRAVAGVLLVIFVLALIVGPVARPGSEVQLADKDGNTTTKILPAGPGGFLDGGYVPGIKAPIFASYPRTAWNVPGVFPASILGYLGFAYMVIALLWLAIRRWKPAKWIAMVFLLGFMVHLQYENAFLTQWFPWFVTYFDLGSRVGYYGSMVLAGVILGEMFMDRDPDDSRWVWRTRLSMLVMGVGMLVVAMLAGSDLSTFRPASIRRTLILIGASILGFWLIWEICRPLQGRKWAEILVSPFSALGKNPLFAYMFMYGLVAGMSMYLNSAEVVEWMKMNWDVDFPTIRSTPGYIVVGAGRAELPAKYIPGYLSAHPGAWWTIGWTAVWVWAIPYCAVCTVATMIANRFKLIVRL